MKSLRRSCGLIYSDTDRTKQQGRIWQLPAGSPGRRLVVLGVLMILAQPGIAHASTHRGPALTCRSGTTLFKARGGRVRVFEVVRNFYEASSGYRNRWSAFYVCRPGARGPSLFFGDPYSRNVRVRGFRIFGAWLGFVGSSEGVSSGGYVNVGWIDLRTGHTKEGHLEVIEEGIEGPEPPQFPLTELQYAIAPDGTVAVIGEWVDHTWEVAELPVKRDSLGSPKTLFATTKGQEGLDPKSIGINASSITWRTKSGQAQSAQR